MQGKTFKGGPGRLGALIVAALGIALLLPVTASAQGVCEGYAKRKRLEKLGGPNSFTKGGVETVADLQAAFEEQSEDIKFLLETQGMFELIPAVFDAVRSGKVSERSLQQGEVFDWMAFRWRGKPMVTDGVCVATKDTYDAFVIEVTTGAPQVASCEVVAEPSCEYGHETVAVSAAGSSPGVSVSMSGGGAERTILADAAAESSWRGELDDPWRNTITFTASADSSPGAATIYTFLVPKACLNLAFVGKKEIEAAGGGCSESVAVACKPTTPSCQLTTSAAEISTRDALEVDVSGAWAGDLISVAAVDGKGNPVEGIDVGSSFPTSITFPRAGDYTLVGTATNEIGETSTCEAQVKVIGRWTARFNVGPAYASDEDTADGVAVPVGLVAAGVDRTKFLLDQGYGGEVGLTYRFNNRIGLNGSLGYALFDTLFEADSADDWQMEDEEVSVFTLSVGPEITFNPGQRAEVYFTPFIGWLSYGNPSYEVFGQTVGFDIDDQFAWGAAVGVDIPFSTTSPWNLNFQVRYTGAKMQLDPQVGAGEDDLYSLDLNPLAVGVGLSFDF